MAKPSEAASHKQKNTFITFSRVGRRGRGGQELIKQPVQLIKDGAAQAAMIHLSSEQLGTESIHGIVDLTQLAAVSAMARELFFQ
jgi:hypothetical protein